VLWEACLKEKLKAVIFKTGAFSLLFYELRKKGESLTPTSKFIERQCPLCKGKVVMKRTGKGGKYAFPVFHVRFCMFK